VDLGAAVESGKFRADLYFRLNVISLNVPPLRDRKQDIPTLARYVHARTASGRQNAPRGFHTDAVAAMVNYSWPGNVRELFNRVQRAVFMCENALIRPEDLGLDSTGQGTNSENLQAARVEAEKLAIRASLDRARQNVTLAARDLGVSRMTLYRLLAKHSITPVAD
jgi:DNA-binding NtrC family response regulator